MVLIELEVPRFTDFSFGDEAEDNQTTFDHDKMEWQSLSALLAFCIASTSSMHRQHMRGICTKWQH